MAPRFAITMSRRPILTALGHALLLGMLLVPARADAQSTSGHTQSTRPTASDPNAFGVTSPPEFENRPRSNFENALMGELACTCGSCDLEPINTCRCDFAAEMRGEVRKVLDGFDVTTEAGRRAATEAVKTSFVAQYGPKVKRHSVDPNGHFAGGVVVALFAGAALLIGRSVRRSRRRKDG